MSDIIGFFIGNFTLTFLLIGLIIAIIAILRRKPGSPGTSEILLRNFIFWGIGITYLYNFVMHVFFAETAAGFIGWENSPFQYEVGYASLGFAVVAFCAFRSNFQFRLAS
ncbi:MAG: DUF6790 family protein, partial [Puniceicoccales bacterium]